MIRNTRNLTLLLLAAFSLILASCKKDNTLMYGNLTMGNFVGDKFISDQGNEFTIVENNTGETFEGIERAIMQCDVLNKIEGTENGYDVRVSYVSEVLTKAPIESEVAAADPEKLVEDPINVDYAWVAGGYLNLYLLFEVQYSPKVENSKHMVNLVYTLSKEESKSAAENEAGKYTFTLRHNAYGETLTKEEEIEDQVQLQSSELIQWGLGGGYVSFQLSELITEKEAEITINWKEHVKDPYNNWLAEVIDKTVTLNYSKDQFQQTPLNLTTKTVVLK